MDMDPVIHVCSSSEVFGKVPRERVPIDEEEKFHPASPYAISKVGTDLVGRFYAQAYGMKIMTTRMFTHTGPRRGDVFAESTFAKQIAMIKRGMLPPVIKSREPRICQNLGGRKGCREGILHAGNCEAHPGRILQRHGSYTCTVGQMLKYLMSLSTFKNIKVQADQERMRPLDADVQVPNTAKFRKHTGWKPEIPLKRRWRAFLEYWRQKTANGRVFLSR